MIPWLIVESSRAAVSGVGKEHGLSIDAPMFVKCRDEKTDAATKLEDRQRKETVTAN